MNFFNFKSDEDLIKLLKKSKQDFQFEQNQVKDRLLVNIRQAPIKTPHRTFFSLTIIKYSASFAGLIIFVSATFTVASNSKPGERLFALNKFGEKVILSLPLSMEQEAMVHADIVSRRLEALLEIEDNIIGPILENIPTVDTQPEVKQPETIKPEAKQQKAKQLDAKLPEDDRPEEIQSETIQPETEQAEDKELKARQQKARQLEAKQLETVRESDESIKDAIETVSKNKQRLERSGRTEASRKLGKILNQIDDLAKKHEERIKSMEASVPDKKFKQSIDQHLLEIKNSRHKARTELNLQEEKDDNPVEEKPQEEKIDNSTD